MMSGMWLWMAIWGLVGLAALVVAVLGVIWLAQRLPNPKARDSHALEVLRLRYANGEIDEAEYAKKRTALDG
jgi:putative membrane protein